MKKALQFIAISALGLSCQIVNAETTADKGKLLEHGEKMHADHCLKCHTDSVYTRDDRFVKSLNALSKQVVRCKDNTGAPWFDEDTEAVVHFLNEKYYKF
jgi:mono/diheme cytochrome c family protein